MARPLARNAWWWGLLLFASPAAAQSLAPTPGQVFKTNFDIPDSPAFDLLGVDPSTILKPQTARDLTLQLSKFQGSDGGFALPRAFAAEFSPVLLVKQNDQITAADYKKYRLAYSTRFSLAALRDSVTGVTERLAFGARLSLVDDKFLATDEEFDASERVTPLTKQINDVHVGASDRAVAQWRSTDHTRWPDPEVYQRHLQEVDSLLTAEDKETIRLLAEEIERRFTKRYWNKTVLDIAIGGRGTAADSTGRALRLDALSAWISWSKGFGQWGQLLLGGRLGATRGASSSTYANNAGLSGRFYVGSRQAKAFVEAQNTMIQNQESVLLLNSGLELAMNDWIWLDLSAGAETPAGGRWRSTTSFKLKTGLVR